MGWGDEIIATGQAKRNMSETGRRTVFLDRLGSVRTHVAWLRNPNIISRSEPPGNAIFVTNCPGARPYIDSKLPERWIWKDFQPSPGELYFTDEERNFAQEATKSHPLQQSVIIEPNLKARASVNKLWPDEYWRELVTFLRLSGLVPTQLGERGTRRIEGTRFIYTPDMRHAAAVMAKAQAAILPEGGLHHTAAALGIPAVVIYGGYISPKQTGYPTQRALFSGGQPCGMRIRCEHCAEAMLRITPELVLEQLLEKLSER